MLLRIKSIKGLAVYDNYTLPTGMIDFKEKNIIYGWNYSGKTTLSRLFSFLEHKSISADCLACSFEIETTDGTVTEKNLATSNLTVRVFNADFITDNLNFAGSEAKPILLLGTESEAAQLEIERSLSERSRCIKGADRQANQANLLKRTLDKIKTDAASKIKSTISLVAGFGSNHLEKLIEIVRSSDKNYRLPPDKYAEYLKLARTADEEKLNPLNEIPLDYKLVEHTIKTQQLLSLKPSTAKAIERLIQNPRIEKWVEEGLYIHSNETTCNFCGNDLNLQILRELREHFSESLNEYRNKLEALISEIARDLVPYTPPKEIEINYKFRKSLISASTKYQENLTKYNNSLLELTEKLKSKLNAPFSEISIDTIEAFKIHTTQNDFVQSAEHLAKLIKENNNLTSDFVTLKAEAIERLKLHHTQEFVDYEYLHLYDAKFNLYDRHRAKYLALSDLIQKRVADLEAQISRALPGSNEMNKRIEYLLGPNCVQIVVVKNAAREERFQLRRRDGKVAKHLSEGEKTAIAFSFFLTKLGEIKKIEDAIIYIDDPISSLDSNHIFQVNAIIKETFFKLGADKSWSTTCKQVFFSTHNFEFLGLLRDINPKSNQKNKSSNFLIRKISPDTSTLEAMPTSMLDYSSEYHFLFEVLHDFHIAQNKSDYKVLMLLPNAVRRFVELYTYAKYPAPSRVSVDERADKIFGSEKSKRILKVFHFFSHANNIERLMGNSDLMCDVEGAVTDLMTLLEADPTHLGALKNGLKV